ncbi:hypothetical protein RHMOL_Rhmol01G0110700 [Rhododendron molle]|uniref:Uncharacterized protein n=1 Tax=Rhododendron molle TaxID=49168 RepID=A0ACC0Q216_RHOML|nr:hypothetical protein RHMOL_Rhmol01G0110700 [Rhododendron molle]
MGSQRHLIEHDKKEKLLQQKVELHQTSAGEYKKLLAQSEDTRRSQEITIANLNDVIKGLQDGAEQARAEGKDEGLTEGKALGRKEMEEEMKKELQAHYDKGYQQAEEDAAEEIMAVQTELREEQHKKSFMLGFNTGFDEAGVEADDERRSLVEVPPVEAAEAQGEPPAPEETTVDVPPPENTQAPPVDQNVSSSATITPEAQQ